MAKLASTDIYGRLLVTADIESIGSVRANSFYKPDGAEVAYVGHNHSASDLTSGTILAARLPSATTSAAGIVRLSSSTSSTSTTLAATASAVKAAYDKANHSHPYAPTSHNHAASNITSGTISTARLPSASTSASGIVQLSSSTSSTSTTLAATASAVKAAYDKGNHSHPYASTSHSHSANDITSGVVTGDLGATKVIRANAANSGTAGGISLYGADPMLYGIARRATSGEGTYGDIRGEFTTYFCTSGGISSGWIFKVDGTNVASISGAGVLTAGKIRGAVYNDYAEYFAKDEDIDFCYIVQKNPDGKGYIKSRKAYSKLVVGVVSNTYGHLLGGDGKETDPDNYVPVGVAGRVKVYVIGKVNIGDLIVSSDLPGIGMSSEKYIPGTVVGKALESSEEDGVNKIEILIMNL